MKKKIVIKVGANCDRCRRKAMKIASGEDGVQEIAIEGDDREKLVVKGEGIDAACLARTLKKKLCYASLESIEEVRRPPPVVRPPTPAPNPVPAPAPAPPPAPAPAPLPYYQPQIDLYNNYHYGTTPSCLIQ